MFNVGGGEVLVILIAALVLLGPDKLPNAARQVGKYLAEFRKISQGFQDELKNAMDVSLEPDPEPVAYPPADPGAQPSPEPTPAPEPAADQAPEPAEPPTELPPTREVGPADPTAA